MILPVTTLPAPDSAAEAGADPAVVIVPGLRDHVAEHWQTNLADALTADGHEVHTVPPLRRERFSRAARVTALEEAASKVSGPIVLIAHSAGVIITVHWATQYRTDRIRGARYRPPRPTSTSRCPRRTSSGRDPGEGPRTGRHPVGRRPLPSPGGVRASPSDVAPRARAHASDHQRNRVAPGRPLGGRRGEPLIGIVRCDRDTAGSPSGRTRAASASRVRPGTSGEHGGAPGSRVGAMAVDVVTETVIARSCEDSCSVGVTM
jgi:hypothetical protein